MLMMGAERAEYDALTFQVLEPAEGTRPLDEASVCICRGASVRGEDIHSFTYSLIYSTNIN